MAVWNPRANEIFLTALEINDPEQRNVYLDSVCAGDAGLRLAVEALLHAHAEAGSFLDRPGEATTAPEVDEDTAAASTAEKPGTIIAGRYKLLQQIGEGGMGAVWMAEQLEPVRRQVALKVIKQGMDSGQVLVRFEAERQALALMDHPNIAKVLDAGQSESGRPFFVMELVKGIVITKYCEEKRLTLRQRLELMIPVCQAVQHAHQKGIIHRDLKPSNVMIALYDGKPVPKVIDFGVAKAVEQPLTEQTLFTGYGSIVGTLEYMSPEQAGLNQVDVDTRSDVYSLGVILYELLTGSTPMDRKRLKEGALLQVLMMIREVEPPTPSKRLSTSEILATLPSERQTELVRLSKLIRGEVDWIVMKALDKDRNRRYETANSFAEDLQRYLADEPVRAGPPSRSYRLRKFVKRNRAAVLGAATVLLALVAGILGTTWGLVWALGAEGQAEQRAAEALTQKKRAALAEADARDQEREAKAKTVEVQKLALAEKAARQKAEQNELRAETARHALLIDQALKAWEVNDVMEAERLLAAVAKPFQKTWETRYLGDLCQRKSHLLSNQWDIVHSELAFAGDVPSIVGIAREDGSIQKWDSVAGLLQPTPQKVRWPLANFGRFGCVLALSRDGRFLAARDNRGVVKVWEAKINPGTADFKLLQGLFLDEGLHHVNQGLHQIYSHLAFSPDGQSLVGQSYLVTNNGASLDEYNMLMVWDVATGQQKLTLKNAASCNAAWTQDGRLAYIDLKGSIWIKNFSTGKATTVVKNLVDPGGTRPVRFQLAISNDGKRAATASVPGLTVKVWDTATGLELRSVTVESPGLMTKVFNGLAISGNGRWIVASLANSDLLRVWNVETGKLHATIRDLKGTSLAVSNDGRHVLCGWYVVHEYRDRMPGRVWDLTASKEKLFLKEREDHGVQELAINRKGNRIASGGVQEKIVVWDENSRKEKFTIPKIGSLGRDRPGLAMDPEGKNLFGAGSDGLLRVWDMETGKEKEPIAVKNCRIFCATVADQGRRLLTGDGDGMVRFWDLVNHRQERAFKGHERPIRGIFLSEDGKLLAVLAEDNRVRWWDVFTGRELGGIAHTEVFALSPDGQFLVSKSQVNEFQVWEMPSGRLKFDLKGHTRHVYSVAITPDSQRIVTASSDGTVRLWDAATGQELLILKNRPGVYFQNKSLPCVAVSGDGRRIVAGDSEGAITVWEAP